jgi:aspartyl-tRNA(Asn)/glutamyl-tRNA(Gln) amidotransferase subunit C
MAIDRKDVQHVARLARLELSEEQIQKMILDLGKIVGYVALLDELDTEDVPPTNWVAVERTPLRVDQPHPGLSIEQALAEAPRSSDGAFAVPAFVEER